MLTIRDFLFVVLALAITVIVWPIYFLVSICRGAAEDLDRKHERN